MSLLLGLATLYLVIGAGIAAWFALAAGPTSWPDRLRAALLWPHYVVLRWWR